MNQIIPEGASVDNIKNLPKAWLNIIPYREVGRASAEFLLQEFNMPYTTISPIGVVETSKFIRQLEQILNQ